MAEGKDIAPHRHQPDLFTVDLLSAPLKELIPHLEHPFFGLSKRPLHGIHRYEDGKGNWAGTPSRF